MNIIIFTIIKSINIKNIIFYVINIIRPRGDTWRLGSCLGAGHTSCTHTLGLRPLSWAHPCAHVGSCLCAGHTPTHTWRLGTPRPNYHWALHAAEPKITLSHWLAVPKIDLGPACIGPK
jgi:hypothetical protein